MSTKIINAAEYSLYCISISSDEVQDFESISEQYVFGLPGPLFCLYRHSKRKTYFS